MSEAIDGLQVEDKSTKEIDVVMQDKSESGKTNQDGTYITNDLSSISHMIDQK